MHFSVANLTNVIQQACVSLSNRCPVTLELNIVTDSLSIVPNNTCCTGFASKMFASNVFLWQLLPARRLVIVGAGPYLPALESFAKQSEFHVSCWSPEFDDSTISSNVRFCESSKSQHLYLSRTSTISPKHFDEWTAAVFLFHEHDWEPKLIEHVLKTDCFYIGALGSRKTHSLRLRQLRDRGVCESDLARVHGPAGLPIGARTPNEIALSIMAEIVTAFRHSTAHRLIARNNIRDA